MSWAASGGMALTGHRDKAPALSPAPAFELLGAASRALSEVTGQAGNEVVIDPAATVFGRAGWSGRGRDGRQSVGGTSRILRTADGWCAVTLSRPDDHAAIPAILGAAPKSDAWTALATAARLWSAKDLVDRAQLLGVPAAVVPPRSSVPSRPRFRAAVAPGAECSSALRADMPLGPHIEVPWRTSRIAAVDPAASLRGCLVVDLSALWAGPLCARLLGSAGARVVKVESVHRPDAFRAGNPELYRWLHDGHEFRCVDFRSAAGRAELAALIAAADVVIEASRPRALAQLGLAPADVAHRPGRVWLSLTGYGRGEPMRVAFGDDAAAAGGLVGWCGDEPVFCGDAIADPLSGICAALAVATAVRAGGGVLIDLSMRATAAAFAAAPEVAHGPHRVVPDGKEWVVDCAAHGLTQRVLPPPIPDRYPLPPSGIRC
ncbi:CoA transferase [Nocardia sp. NPDC050712]|uniref:CoA transferase n=1 Tax=Nocardia sp. NPDC050712 TaxID=3155518 RepID=UPI0033C2995D